MKNSVFKQDTQFRGAIKWGKAVFFENGRLKTNFRGCKMRTLNSETNIDSYIDSLYT